MNGPALRVHTGSGAPTRFFSRISVKTSHPHTSSYLAAQPIRIESGQAAERGRSRLTDPQARPTIHHESTPPQTGRRPKPKGRGADSLQAFLNPASRPAQPLPRRHRPACGQQTIASPWPTGHRSARGQQTIASLWPTSHRQPIPRSAPRAVTAHPSPRHLPRWAQDPAGGTQPDPAKTKENNVPLIGRP
jgi:hypothetical protein